MSYFGYDPEVPAGFQDADFEMAELEATGNRMAALRRKGVCVHDSTFCDPEGDGTVECCDCNAKWRNHDDWYEDYTRIVHG